MKPGSSRQTAQRPIRFEATLHRPKASSGTRSRAPGQWTFLMLPPKASAKLPSRGMVAVQGTLNGLPLLATLEPDGKGGHWMRVDAKLQRAIGVEAGASVALELTPVRGGRAARGVGGEVSAASPGETARRAAPLESEPLESEPREPEPTVPADLRRALAAAPRKAREAWADITPAARRDWVHWITSGKRAETRGIRIEKACDMLSKGKRRPCCFDRSGMYSKSLSCPEPEDAATRSGER